MGQKPMQPLHNLAPIQALLKFRALPDQLLAAPDRSSVDSILSSKRRAGIYQLRRQISESSLEFSQFHKDLHLQVCRSNIVGVSRHRGIDFLVVLCRLPIFSILKISRPQA